MRSELVGRQEDHPVGSVDGIPIKEQWHLAGAPTSTPPQLAAELLSSLAQHGVPLREANESFQKWYIRYALERHQFNQSATARALGIHRNSLVRLLSKWKWNGRIRRFV